MSTNISNLEDHLGYWLNLLAKQVEASFSLKLEKLNMTIAQWVVLRSLYERESTSLGELAEIINLDDSSLSRMVERLVQKGFVIREIDSKNRRAVKLRLTPQSTELVPKLAIQADENDVEFFKDISEKRKEEFLGTIKYIIEKKGLIAKPKL